MAVPPPTLLTAVPRFEMPESACPARSDTDRLQLRRALRALLGQRGGAMLMTLHGGFRGVQLRMDCSVESGAAAVAITTADEAAAQLVRGSTELLRFECARCGYDLARVQCTGPATRPLAA